jgi:hypothetical protein
MVAGEVQVFDAENLYDLVDGQAGAFCAYAFEQAAMGDYENAEGEELRVEMWQVATPAAKTKRHQPDRPAAGGVR